MNALWVDRQETEGQSIRNPGARTDSAEGDNDDLT